MTAPCGGSQGTSSAAAGRTDNYRRAHVDQSSLAQAVTDLELRITAVNEVTCQPFRVKGHDLRITVSGGVATSDSCPPAELLGAAGAAMHAAKRRGAGNIEVFDPARAGEVRARFELSVDLSDALDQDGLDLHYQPIVELSTGRLVGVEALARWTHPVKGSISAEVFVSVAEQCGLACQLDRWALQLATTDLARLRALDLADLSRILSSTGDRFDVTPPAHTETPGASGERAAREHGLALLLRLHREGASHHTIAAGLNSQNYQTPQRTRRHRTSVAAVIADLAYPHLWKRTVR